MPNPDFSTTETIPGGYYLDVNGVPRDCNGKEVPEIKAEKPAKAAKGVKTEVVETDLPAGE